MLQHGDAVRAKFLTLVQAMADGAVPEGWRTPSWLRADTAPDLLRRLPDSRTLELYQRYHDCGKHLVRAFDAEGRQHFPGHALASAAAWREQGGGAAVACLIAQDMDLHLLRADEVPAFAARDSAAALLLTALAEVHANADLFGGQEAPGFKAKLKHLERRGRAILKEWAREGSPAL